MINSENMMSNSKAIDEQINNNINNLNVKPFIKQPNRFTNINTNNE